jgi:hypothetical protein
MEFIPHLLIEGMITPVLPGCKPILYLHSWRIHVGLQILERAIAKQKQLVG